MVRAESEGNLAIASARWLALATLALALTSCAAPGGGEPSVTGRSDGDPGLSVYTVNYPLAYFAKRIGGDSVDVVFPVPPGTDPAFWSPDPETVAAYQAADLILLHGAGYAAWVRRSSLPASRAIDTSAGFLDRLLAAEKAAVHSHGPEGEHSHAEVAFTTWLDPELAVQHARAILDAFSAARPGYAAAYREAFEDLERDLLALDASLRLAFERIADRPVLASHPVYQYLAARYGLALESVHFEPDEPPDAGAWRELEAVLRDHPARWMLWEGRPLEETSRRLERLDVRSVVFDPCGNAPADGDYLDVMRANVRNLTETFPV